MLGSNEMNMESQQQSEFFHLNSDSSDFSKIVVDHEGLKN